MFSEAMTIVIDKHHVGFLSGAVYGGSIKTGEINVYTPHLSRTFGSPAGRGAERREAPRTAGCKPLLGGPGTGARGERTSSANSAPHASRRSSVHWSSCCASNPRVPSTCTCPGTRSSRRSSSRTTTASQGTERCSR